MLSLICDISCLALQKFDLIGPHSPSFHLFIIFMKVSISVATVCLIPSILCCQISEFKIVVII